MEQGNLANQIPSRFLDFKATCAAWPYSYGPYDPSSAYSGTPLDCSDNGNGIPAWAANRVKPYECPAVNNYATLTSGVMDTLYMYNNGSATLAYADQLPNSTAGFTGTPGYSITTFQMAACNYAGNAGMFGPSAADTIDNPSILGASFTGGNFTDLLVKYIGPFNLNSKTRITDIADGTSNTIAFGESKGCTDGADGSRDFKWSWGGMGAMAGLSGPVKKPRERWSRYSSNHSGVINFAMCDGSVRTFNKQDSAFLTPPNLPAWYFAWAGVLGMADGTVPDFSLIGN